MSIRAILNRHSKHSTVSALMDTAILGIEYRDSGNDTDFLYNVSIRFEA